MRRCILIIHIRPLSFLTITVKLIDVSRFVESAIKLFLWSPSKNIWSLVQKCGALLCNYEDSIKKQTNAEKHVSESFQELVCDILNEFDLTQLNNNMLIPEITEILMNHLSYRPSEQEIDYFRISIRVAQKRQFINSLGEDSQKECIIHLAKTQKRMIHELGFFMDPSTLISAFFQSLKVNI